MVCIFDDDDDGMRDDDDGSLKRKRTGGCLRARHCCGFCSSFYPPCTAYMLVVVEVSMSCVVLMQRGCWTCFRSRGRVYVWQLL